MVFCTTPDLKTAQVISEHLIDKNLAACCNILPAVESVYKWKGKVEKGQECMLLIKSTEENYQKIENAIIKVHPYEVPEVIATQIIAGSAPYLDWIKKVCSFSGVKPYWAGFL